MKVGDLNQPQETSFILMKRTIQIGLEMRSDWKNTSRVQEGVWNLVNSSLDDESRADSISMVSAELLENAIKYGDKNQGGNTLIFFNLRGNEDEIIVEVKNKIHEGADNDIRSLDETIQWIRGYQNPFEAYLERLYSVARAPGGESRMGMFRMAYEASAILDFFVNENDEISVSATIPLK